MFAFVTLPDGVDGKIVTPKVLRKHCTSTDVSKPKAGFEALQAKAMQQAHEKAEPLPDALGQMKKFSKGELFENAVIHRCYAFWMLGAL